MKLEGLMSVSGKPGLYQMVGNRKSGLVIEPIGGGTREFAASRQHQFTPIESIAIFTDDGESVPIKDVLKRMLEQEEDNPPPAAKAKAEALREYMLDVLPNHDQERVYTNDIKKLVRWYAALKSAGVLDAAEEEETEVADGANEAPAADAAGKEATTEPKADAKATPDAQEDPAADESAAEKKPVTKKSTTRASVAKKKAADGQDGGPE